LGTDWGLCPDGLNNRLIAGKFRSAVDTCQIPWSWMGQLSSRIGRKGPVWTWLLYNGKLIVGGYFDSAGSGRQRILHHGMDSWSPRGQGHQTSPGLGRVRRKLIPGQVQSAGGTLATCVASGMEQLVAIGVRSMLQRQVIRCIQRQT